MIIRCDNCSVSLQLDESKIPSGNFTVRCPRCQNMLRANKDLKGTGSHTVQQLADNKPAAPADPTDNGFAEKQSEFEINNALKMLLSALKTGNEKIETGDDVSQKPRRVLLCLGEKRDDVAQRLSDAGYRVYIAQTPAQANERLREGKTEIVIFSPDFAPELG